MCVHLDLKICMFHDVLNQVIGINVVVSVHIDTFERNYVSHFPKRRGSASCGEPPVVAAGHSGGKCLGSLTKWVERWKVPGPSMNAGRHHKQHLKSWKVFRTTALLISKIGNTKHHDFSIFFQLLLSLIFIRALFPEGGGTGRLPWNSHGGRTNSKFGRNMEKNKVNLDFVYADSKQTNPPWNYELCMASLLVWHIWG